VSHPEEAKLLNDVEYQGKLARAISVGVQKFLEQIEARDGKK
jgi:N-acetylmuramoyl-L-alanine amidase